MSAVLVALEAFD